MESLSGGSASKLVGPRRLGRFRIASNLALLVTHGIVMVKRLDAVCKTFCCLHSAHAVFFRVDAGEVCWGWVSSILATSVLDWRVAAQSKVRWTQSAQGRVAGLDNGSKCGFGDGFTDQSQLELGRLPELARSRLVCLFSHLNSASLGSQARQTSASSNQTPSISMSIQR
jgi:hypothetical protein